MKKKTESKKRNFLQSAMNSIFWSKATIALCIAIITAFFLLSTNHFFAEQNVIDNFSFSFSRYWNILPYVFVHNSFVHLIANVSAILVFGVLLENRIGFRKMVLLLVFSAVLPAILFSIINPQHSLFGASAVSSGLIGAGFLLQPKKTITAAIILAIIILFVIKPGGMQLYEDYKKNIAVEIAKTAEEKIVAAKSGETAIAQRLAQKESELEQFLDSLRVQELVVAGTSVANTAHAFGAITGFAFAYFFVPNKFNRRKSKPWKNR